MSSSNSNIMESFKNLNRGKQVLDNNNNNVDDKNDNNDDVEIILLANLFILVTLLLFIEDCSNDNDFNDAEDISNVDDL